MNYWGYGWKKFWDSSSFVWIGFSLLKRGLRNGTSEKPWVGGPVRGWRTSPSVTGSIFLLLETCVFSSITEYGRRRGSSRLLSNIDLVASSWTVLSWELSTLQSLWFTEHKQNTHRDYSLLHVFLPSPRASSSRDTSAAFQAFSLASCKIGRALYRNLKSTCQLLLWSELACGLLQRSVDFTRRFRCGPHWLSQQTCILSVS